MKKSLLFSLTLPGIILQAEAAVVFSESFDDLTGTSTSVRPLSEGNWAGYYGNGSTPATVPSHSTGSHRSGVVKNTNGTAPNTVENYLFAQNVASAPVMDYFLYTTSLTVGGTPGAFSFAPADYSSITATWNRNGNSVAAYYMTVQVNGDWYVSGTAFGSTFSNSFDLLASTWKNLIIDTGASGSLAIGTEISDYDDLFGGGDAITGVGFYINGLIAGATDAARTIRIDEIQIEAIPEVSTAFLACGGALLSLTRRRRLSVSDAP